MWLTTYGAVITAQTPSGSTRLNKIVDSPASLGSDNRDGTDSVTRQRALLNALKRLGLELHNYHDINSECPNRSDFAEWIKRGSDSELLGEVEGQSIILWNSLPKNFSEAFESASQLKELLVAYEKNAEKHGGYALFLDGSTTELTPAELLPLYVAARERVLLKRAKKKAIAKTQDTASEDYDPVKAIKSLGGGIDITSSFKYVQLGSGRNENISDKDLVHLSHFPDLKMLDLYGAKITDEGLGHLSKLVNLEQLDLRDNQIKGPGLKHLSKMQYLKHLYLDNTEIGDDDLVHLKDLKSLTRLGLNSTKVTGPGLEHLRGLTQLEVLNLSFNGLTDEAIEPLSKMKSLKFLTSLDPKVTKEGLQRLQKALPNCQIVFFD